MNRLIYIGFGGAAGAVLRYIVSGAVQRRLANTGFPAGTLMVNLAGSLLIGILWGITESVVISQNIRLFLYIGLIGAFTTFSTFSYESFHLIREGETFLFFINVILSVVCGIMLVFAGYISGRYVINILR